MLRPACNESWPESWKLSNTYDEIEVWGGHSDLGYSYQYRNRREWALHAIGELVPSGAGILDVAAASGNFTLALAEMGYCVIWNDLRGELAELVRLKYEFGQVEFAPGNIFDLAGAWAACFDAVVAFEVIEHMAHPDQFLACIAAMVKPGGRIFLTTPNGRYFRFHLPRFSECPDPSIYEAVQFKPNSDGHIFLLDAAEFRTMAAGVGLEIDRSGRDSTVRWLLCCAGRRHDAMRRNSVAKHRLHLCLQASFDRAWRFCVERPRGLSRAPSIGNCCFAHSSFSYGLR